MYITQYILFRFSIIYIKWM